MPGHEYIEADTRHAPWCPVTCIVRRKIDTVGICRYLSALRKTLGRHGARAELRACLERMLTCLHVLGSSIARGAYNQRAHRCLEVINNYLQIERGTWLEKAGLPTIT